MTCLIGTLVHLDSSGLRVCSLFGIDFFIMVRKNQIFGHFFFMFGQRQLNCIIRPKFQTEYDLQLWVSRWSYILVKMVSVSISQMNAWEKIWKCICVLSLTVSYIFHICLITSPFSNFKWKCIYILSKSGK